MLRGSGQQSSNAGRTFAKTGVLATGPLVAGVILTNGNCSSVMIATIIGFVARLEILLLLTKHADAGTQEIYL